MREVYMKTRAPENCSTCLYGPNAVGWNGKPIRRLGCAHADRQEDWLSKVLALAKLKLREPENQKPVVHAHWIDDSGEGDAAVCSNCGECYDTTEAESEWRKAFELFKQFYHYCPNCGAIMDEEV